MSVKSSLSGEKIEFYAFLSVLVFNILSTLWFIVSNNMPLSWDPALHMLYSYIYYKLITSFNFGAIIHVSNYYPPLFHLTAAFMYILFGGFSEKIGMATNILFYLLLIYAVFRTSHELWGDRVAYLSSILISGYPFLIVLERKFMLDFAFTAMVALTIYFFIKSENLRNIKYSALFGLSFGLATLTKWDAFLYVLPFVIPKIYFEYCQKLQEIKSVVGNVSVAAILAFLSAAWWYLPNLFVVTRRLEYFANIGGKEGDPTFWTFRGWMYYIKALDMSLGIIFMVLFLVSVIYAIYSRKMDNTIKSMMISIFVIYVVLTFLSNKDNRYILPVLPFIAWVTGYYLNELSGVLSGRLNIRRYIVTIIISLIVILQISSVTFAVPNTNNPYILLSDHPKSQNWHIKDILSTIAKYAKPGDVVITLADHPYLNGQSLDFYRIIYGYNFKVFNGVYLPVNIVIKNFNKINFIVLIKPRVHKGVYGNVEKILYKTFYKYEHNFKLIGKYPLPDGTTVYIFMNKYNP